MAKKVKYETTNNFDLEGDLDIPDFDFGESDSKKKDDRKPATKAARGLFEGMKDEIFSPNLIRSSIRNALPPAYGQTAERVDDVVGTVRDLYTDAVKELKPAIKDLKRTTRKLLPKTEGILPKKIQGMLTEWSQEEKQFGSDYNQQKARDQGLAIELGKIFEAQAEDNDRREALAEEKDNLREGITQLRHGQTVRQLAGVGEDIHRLVAYQDKVLANYHRKSLELQYRHYFATVDMLELQREVARSQKSQLDDIKKNTGLPEFVKITASEEFRKGLKNKFAGMLGDGLFGGMRDYLSKFTKNVAERAKMKVSDFVGGVKDAASMADMATDTMDMASGMGDMGPDQHELGGRMAGSLATEWGLGKAQKWVGKKIGGHEGIRKLNEKLHYGLNNSENLIGDYLNNPETNWGMLDGLRQFLAESAPSTQPDTALQSHNLMKMDDPAPFTRSASRSLVEIIPGYLARIHREIKVLRTGDTSTPLTTYSYLNNQFTTVKASAKDLKEKLFNRYERDDVHEKLDELIKFVDPKGTLDANAQKAFKKELLTQSINRKNTDAAHVQRRSHWSGAGEHAPKIAQLFRDKLEIDPDTEKRADTLSAIEAQNAYSTKMKNVTSWLNDPRELIQQLRLLGGDDTLHELNLLDKKKPDRINLDAFRDMLLEDEHGALGADMGQYANGNKLRKVRRRDQRLQAEGPQRAQPSIVHQQIQPVTATVLPPAVDPKQHEAIVSRMDQLLEGVRKLDKEHQPNPLIQAIHDATLNIEKSLKDGIKVINLDMEVLSNKFAEKINDGLGKFASMRDSMMSSMSNTASKIKKRFQDLTIGEALGKVTSGAVGALGFARKQGQKMLNRGLGLGKQGVKLGLQGAGLASTALKATLGRYYGDLYVGDEKLPRLTQARLEAGYYVDALTGKPLKSFKGITGPVKDIGNSPEGVVVLTAEELKQAYLKGEYPEMLTSIAKGLAGFSIEKLTQARGLIKGGFAIGLNMAVMGFKKFKQLLPPWDVYCRDNMETPLLYAVKMKMGDEYFSKKTGKPIKHPRDIDGVVFDKDKNEVVTEQHIETGLCDVNGIALKNVIGRITHKVTKLLGKGIAKLKGLASGALDMLAGIGTYLRDMFGGIFGLRGEYLSTAKKQLDIQTSIYKLLDARIPKPHQVREGSAEQLEAQENAREKSQADEVAKANEQGTTDPKANGGQGLGSMIKGLFSRKKGEKDEGYGLKDQLEVDAAEAAGKKGWGWMKKLGFKGVGKFALKGLGAAGAAYGGYSAYKNFKQGNYGEAGLDAAGATVGAATAVGGFGALMSGAGSVLAGAGSLIAGAAGLISAPVLLTALGVAAVGYGAYKLYKYLTKMKLETLSTVRYAQYGFNSADTQHLQAVFNLEGALTKNMKVSGDKATFDTSKLDLKDLAKPFGVDASNEEQMDKWTRWVNNRFKPVLMASLVNLKNVNGSVDLNDIDKKLNPKEKADYLAKLQGITSSLYDVLTSPFTDQRNLTVDANEMKRVFAYAKSQLDIEAKKAATDNAKTGGKLVAAAAAPAAAAAATGVSKLAGKPGDKPGANAATTATRQALTSSAAAVTSTSMTKLEASANAGVVGAFEQMTGGEGKLGALAAIRMKAYGLFELAQDKVQALRNLELIISKQVKFDKNGASWNEDVEALLNNPMVGAVFGCPGPRSKQGYQWMVWFKFRFLPVYLNFFTSVWKATGKTSFEAFANADYQLKPADALLAGNVMKTTMTTIDGQPAVVWKVQDMPWLNMTANQDVNTVELNIDFLNEQVKKSLLKDQKQPPAAAKAKSTPVAPPPAAPTAKPAAPKVDDKLAGMKKPAGDNPNFFSNASSNMAGLATSPNGATSFSGGDAVKQPGNGTGGDINDIPQAKGSGWDNVKDTILAAAKMVGVDPQLMAMFAAIESGFDPTAIPKDKNGNRLSNAMGLFQFIPSTWNEMMRKFANKYGINPMTPPSDARANALLGAEFLKGNATALKRMLGKDPSTTDLYLAHFLGQGGANQFLHSNPQLAAADMMPKEAQANPGIFYKGGVPSTFAQIYEGFTQKLKSVAAKFKFGSAEPSKPATQATATPPAPTPGTQPSVDRRMPIQAAQAAKDAMSTPSPMAASAPVQKRMKLFTPETRDEANLGATAPTTQPKASAPVIEPAAPQTPPQPVMRPVPNFTGFSPMQTPTDTKRQSEVLHERTNDSIDVLIKNGAAQLQVQQDMAKTLKEILSTINMRSKDQKTAEADTSAQSPVASAKPFRVANTMPTPAVNNDRLF